MTQRWSSIVALTRFTVRKWVTYSPFPVTLRPCVFCIFRIFLFLSCVLCYDV